MFIRANHHRDATILCLLDSEFISLDSLRCFSRRRLDAKDWVVHLSCGFQCSPELLNGFSSRLFNRSQGETLALLSVPVSIAHLLALGSCLGCTVLQLSSQPLEMS